MRFQDLDQYWKHIFEMEWESVSEGNKAIAAVILSEKGEIISEGRNKIATYTIPNPRVLHAEVEAIRALDVKKYPNVKSYVLMTALEPCPMCVGTLVMGGIRHVIIGARDAYGGAMDLLNHSDYLRSKNIQITWMDEQLGDIQRAMQSVKEIYFFESEERLQSALSHFELLNKKGVDAAKKLFSDGYFQTKAPKDYAVQEVFDALMERIEENE